MTRLDEKVIVITGSTRGIGKAIAEACGQNGARLVICSRDKAKVKEVRNSFENKGYIVSGIPVDVSRTEDIQALFKFSLDSWGKIDVWINNAGVSTGYRLLENISAEEINRIVNINLTAVLQASKIVISYFKEQGRGILLNMSGRGGNGDSAAYMVPYTATKAAVTTLTQSLAEENKDYPISINAVIPGMVETDFYNDIKTDPAGEKQLKNLSYVLNAFGVSLDTVGEFFVELAASKPGSTTGKTYSLLKGRRLLRGIVLMSWYKLTGKI